MMNPPLPSDGPSPERVTDRRHAPQFVSFHLEDQLYAFRIEQIREIVMLDQVTRVPQVADFVEGVTNLRGTIIPVVNLRRLLGLAPRPVDANSRTIVVNVGDRIMGCRVDDVSQVIRIPDEEIQPAPAMIIGAEGESISGFARVDEQLVILLDVALLLSTDKLNELKNQPASNPV